MKPEAALLKEILEHVSNVGYQNRPMEMKFEENESMNKRKYHVQHLIKEGYLEGQIFGFTDGSSEILVERMTDKGALVLDTTKNPEFLDWVKKNTGSAFGDLMKGAVSGTASLAWALVKQWLATKGVGFPHI